MYNAYPLSLQNVYANISRIMTVAQRLCDAGHYAAPSIRLQANKLDKDWRTFAAALEDRSTVLALSAIFHKKAEEVTTRGVRYAFCALFDSQVMDM